MVMLFMHMAAHEHACVYDCIYSHPSQYIFRIFALALARTYTHTHAAFTVQTACIRSEICKYSYLISRYKEHTNAIHMLAPMSHPIIEVHVHMHTYMHACMHAPTHTAGQKEVWMTNDQFILRHPWFRVFTSLFIIVCDFVLYGEDPIADSEAEANIPILANVFTFACMKWPLDSSFYALKVRTRTRMAVRMSNSRCRWCVYLIRRAVCLCVCMCTETCRYTYIMHMHMHACKQVFLIMVFGLAGILFGRQVLHNMLMRDYFKINMFKEEQGTFLWIGREVMHVRMWRCWPRAVSCTSKLRVCFRVCGYMLGCMLDC